MMDLLADYYFITKKNIIIPEWTAAALSSPSPALSLNYDIACAGWPLRAAPLFDSRQTPP